MEDGLRLIGVNRWRRLGGERHEWYRIIEEAKAHNGIVTPVEDCMSHIRNQLGYH